MITDRHTLRVALAGGGTGGHLFPGIALAQELKRRLPGVEILFLTTGRPLEAEALSNLEFPFASVPSAPLCLRPVRTGKFIYKSLSGLARARRLFRGYQPDVLVGLGGYGEAPAILAAKLAGIPSVLLEQNAQPGKATRLLQYVADQVYVHWQVTKDFLRRKASVFVTGNPVRSEVTISNPQARAELGLSPAAKTLLVMGGSQGASALNHAVMEALPELSGRKPALQFLHITGPRDCQFVSATYRSYCLSAYVTAFLHDMSLAYSAADLVVCRAGATTLAELATCGLASILVPLPWAAGRHQHANAGVFLNAGAAMVLEQSQLVRRLTGGITRLLNNKTELERMSTNALKLSQQDADKKVVDRLLDLLQKKSHSPGFSVEPGYEL